MLKKINLGCGPVGKDDWINIDWGMLAFLHRFPFIEGLLLKLKLFPAGYNVKWPGNLKLHNCKKRLPFPEASIDYIYTSHFLEHFKKFEARRIIEDCHRVLRKGGVIRVVVPDLELLAQKYLAQDAEYFRKLYSLMNFSEAKSGIPQELVLADVFMDNFYPAFYKNKPAGINRLLAGFVRPHYWMYDHDSLQALLRGAGFVKVQRMSYRRGALPDLDSLDVFPEMSLYLEAEK